MLTMELSLVHASLLLFGIVINILHLISISSTRGKLQAVHLARIAPSIFLLLMTISLLPLEIYRVSSLHRSERSSLNWL
jgi:hypothetical protein